MTEKKAKPVRRSVSTAEQVSRAWKRLEQLQKKHGFSKLQHYEAEPLAGEPYHLGYELADQVVNDAALIVKWMKRIPWK